MSLTQLVKMKRGTTKYISIKIKKTQTKTSIKYILYIYFIGLFKVYYRGNIILYFKKTEIGRLTRQLLQLPKHPFVNTSMFLL